MDKDAEILKRNYDLFDVWNIEDEGIRVPLVDKPGTLVTGSEALASSYGNDLIPLLMELPARGVDVWDREEVISYLTDSGDEMWAGYLADLGDDEWRKFLDFVDLDLPGKEASFTKSALFEVAELLAYIDDAALEAAAITMELGEPEVSRIIKQIQELAQQAKSFIG